MSIKNITILSLVLMASCFMPMVTYADAEFSDAEKEVIWFVDMCEQQASVGEHTEGMSKNNMDLFVSECEKVIAETYGISRADVRSLVLNKRNNVPLSNKYKKPTMSAEQEKSQLNDKIKQLMNHYDELDRADKQAFEMRKKYVPPK